RERSRRTMFVLALASLIAISCGLGWWIGAEARAEAMAQAKSDVEALREAVRQAASERRWVYPSPEQPGETTAYGLLVQLESHEIDAARDIGQQLRAEIAAQLLAHGDSYWDKPGGRSFAREFYANVLVFEPDNARALERAGLSRSALDALRERAATGDFDAFELDAMAPLAALSHPDRRARIEALVEISSDPEQLSAGVRTSIDRLIEELDPSHPHVAPEPPTQAAIASSVGLPPQDAAAIEPAPERPESRPKPTPLDKQAARTEAATLASSGDDSYRAGLRDEAERHYQRALELDGDNLAALVGLHRISFDRGHFKDSLTYAKQALALRPKRNDLNLYVGDACMKVLDYACARTHYEAAEQLGSKHATQRLHMLDERLGTPNEGSL
ncbi:MAG TPA: hypothetical protein VM869_22935, partial [Enhygromyxa sp.]|nr:hypothetical protein [Enhygromyxa sp.]